MKRIDHQFINGVEHKWCNSCLSWKILSEFNKYTRKWDGLCSQCRECNNRESRKWYAANKNYSNEKRRQWRDDHLEYSKEQSRQWQKDHSEYVKNYRQQWRQEHPEYIQKWNQEHTEYFRNWQRDNPERVRQSQRKYSYGITKQEIDTLYLQQGGLCPICHTILEYNDINIEHSHQFNMVRGLCHKRCNLAIARFKDSVELLHRTINYLVEDYETSDNGDRLLFTSYVTARKKYLLPLLESQGYVCPICQCELTPFTAVIEHNHATNLIRSASCNQCNTGLGLFHDDIGFIGQAIQYLIDAEYKILMHDGVIEKSK